MKPKTLASLAIGDRVRHWYSKTKKTGVISSAHPFAVRWDEGSLMYGYERWALRGRQGMVRAS